MNRLAPVAVGLAMVAFAAGAACAQASKDRPGRVGPGQATSTCIGDLRSPLCAAETLLACFARAEPELCRRVGVADPKTVAAGGPAPIEYIVERQSVIRPEDVTEDLKSLDWYKPGYTLIEIRRRSCPAAPSGCATEWTDLQVYVRPRGNQVEIVTWRDDRESEAAPDIPDAFRQGAPRR